MRREQGGTPSVVIVLVMSQCQCWVAALAHNASVALSVNPAWIALSVADLLTELLKFCSCMCALLPYAILVCLAIQGDLLKGESAVVMALILDEWEACI